MSLSRLGDYLDQIWTAANDARHFVEGMSQEDFPADKRTQQAVIMDKHSEFITDHPEIPLARHERYAQSRRPRIFRRQRQCRMGHHSNRSAGFVVAIGASSSVSHRDNDLRSASR